MHSCADTETGISLVERNTTVGNSSRAGHFDTKVFVIIVLIKIANSTPAAHSSKHEHSEHKSLNITLRMQSLSACTSRKLGKGK